MIQNGGQVVLSVGDLLDHDDDESYFNGHEDHDDRHSGGQKSSRTPMTPKTPNTMSHTENTMTETGNTVNTIPQSPFSESDSINIDALISGDTEEDNQETIQTNNLTGAAKLVLDTADIEEDNQETIQTNNL